MDLVRSYSKSSRVNMSWVINTQIITELVHAIVNKTSRRQQYPKNFKYKFQLFNVTSCSNYSYHNTPVNAKLLRTLLEVNDIMSTTFPTKLATSSQIR
jgi:predicted nucleic acid-binding protein